MSNTNIHHFFNVLLGVQSEVYVKKDAQEYSKPGNEL